MNTPADVPHPCHTPGTMVINLPEGANDAVAALAVAALGARGLSGQLCREHWAVTTTVPGYLEGIDRDRVMLDIARDVDRALSRPFYRRRR